MAGGYGYLHRGVVQGRDATTGGYTVRIAALAPGRIMGPFPSMNPVELTVGQRVALASIGSSRDDLVIVGPLPGPALQIADVTGLTAALAGKADDSEITTINATLATHGTRLDGHDTTLASHTGTLASHTGTLTSYGGRLTTLEGKVGYVVPVASAAARPTSGLYDGYPIYRTDKNFMEFYEAATGTWRVRHHVTVSALADITNPWTGQLAVLSTDQLEYRWSGSAWQAIRFVGVAPMIEYRLSATTAIAGSTDTRVPFDTLIGTATDITYDSANRVFTFARAGEYAASCSIRVSVVQGTYLWFAKWPNASSGNRGKTSQNGGLNLATHATIRVTAANEKWAAYTWGSGAFNLVQETPSDSESYAPWVKFRYIGPL